uniref:tRNA (carboxymethyluridine(34)-5-O)-methyltransferase n=1 Tax=Syphacia muris TaxID=451379 RepID=A0A0N5AW43_9BILA
MAVELLMTGESVSNLNDKPNEGKDSKKLALKVKKHLRSLSKHDPDVVISSTPTECLFVANSSVLCGVSLEDLEKVFLPFDNLCNFTVYLDSRPYSFVKFSSLSKAEEAMKELNGKVPCGLKSDALPFYTAFVKNVPAPVEKPSLALPPGLSVIENFIDENEENLLMKHLESCLSSKEQLKSRTVVHFGYKFNYNKNEATTPAEYPMPQCCEPIINRMITRNIFKERPDQLTVNIYEPGDGIPNHVDVHSPFGDTIVALSLMSDIVMDFRDIANTSIITSALLPRFSLLVMQDEGRYRWKHGIAKRKYDVDPKSQRLIKRSLRISFTFRKVATEKCRCKFIEYCDWDRDGFMKVPEDDSHGRDIEKRYVASVYDSIAEHFDVTRHSQWNAVKKFLCSLNPGDVLFDVGCGNGKYLTSSDNLFKFGCDLSEKLCTIARQKSCEVLRADGLALPCKSGFADAVLSIAVIHHMTTTRRRIAAIQELLRCLRKGGRICITVWSFEQRRGKFVSEYLKMRSKKRNVQKNRRGTGELLRVHEGKDFTQQDMLVPFQNNSKEHFLRYYHLFVAGELEQLLTDAGQCEIEKVMYEQGNWIAFVKKL